jgi:crotonobetainyl-CoA:carnitine CoA-transferase CaiB-like acyl-CoA transferase
MGGRPRPKVGEHTRAVLGEAGLSGAEIDALLGGGAAGTA